MLNDRNVKTKYDSCQSPGSQIVSLNSPIDCCGTRCGTPGQDITMPAQGQGQTMPMYMYQNQVR